MPRNQSPIRHYGLRNDHYGLPNDHFGPRNEHYGLPNQHFGLRQRIFGSSSEKKIDPAQLQLLFDELVMGKPAPPPDNGEETSAPEEEKSKASKSRRSKADRFPKNLMPPIGKLVKQTAAPSECPQCQTPLPSTAACEECRFDFPTRISEIQ